MNLPTPNVIPCIINNTSGSSGSGGTGGSSDPRCSDGAFAASHPDICSDSSYLLLKPQSSLIRVLDSIAFSVFEVKNGVESQVIDNLTFKSSDNTVLVIGSTTGGATGIAAGHVTVNVTRNGKSASASVTVLDGSVGCSQTNVDVGILVDNSRSMSLQFGGAYATRLDFADAAAKIFGTNIMLVEGQPKDKVKVYAFSSSVSALETDFTTDTTQVGEDITGITQLLEKTDIRGAIVKATADLLAATATLRVLVILSDGEHTADTNTQGILDAASAFKAAGGIIVAIGVRASSTGCDLFERIATGGFFINAVPTAIDAAFGGIAFIRGILCLGSCIPKGDVTTPTGELDYSSWINWEVQSGQTNLLGNGFFDVCPNNGLYMQLSGDGHAAKVRTIDGLPIESGLDYEISLNLAGNGIKQTSSGSQSIKVSVFAVDAAPTDPAIFETTFVVGWADVFKHFSANFQSQFTKLVKIVVQDITVDTAAGQYRGALIDNVQFKCQDTLSLLFTDDFDNENETYIKPGCGLSAAVDGIDNPQKPSVSYVAFAGASMQSNSTYRYAISYLTAVGETAISPIAGSELPGGTVANTALQLVLPTPPAAAIGTRIWRNFADNNTQIFLLAEIDPAQTLYVDIETHAQFLARYDSSINYPSSNTTSKAVGELGNCTGENPSQTTTKVNFVMTDDTHPHGITSASSVRPTGTLTDYAAFRSTQGVGGSQAGWQASSTSLPQWVQYQFDAPTIVNEYLFIGASFSCSFNLAGSNDGTNWTVLDTQIGMDVSSGVQLDFENSTPYLMYRLTFTAGTFFNSGDAIGAAMVYNLNLNHRTFTQPNTSGCTGCYADPCEPASALGPQYPDPNPLPDIESGTQTPQLFSSTQNFCAQCPNGGLIYTTTDPVAQNTSTVSDGVVFDFGQETIINVVCFTLNSNAVNPISIGLFGSNDGTNWNQIPVNSTTFSSSISNGYAVPTRNASTISGCIRVTPAGYRYFKLAYDTSKWSMSLHSYSQLIPGTSSQICKSAQATSYVSQQDADTKALAAATAAANAELNCLNVYTSTKSYTATCPAGSIGQSVTKSATVTSYNSQADADAKALQQAKDAANAAIDCTGSNNTQAITINDNAAATPYPSVKFVSGLTGVVQKVTVSIKKFRHTAPGDVLIILQSPSGRIVGLMTGCGATLSVSNVDLVFDDAAASQLSTGTVTSGTWKPSRLNSVSNLPQPGPQNAGTPYPTTLATLIGDSPNGAWSLWVADNKVIDLGSIDGGWDLTIVSG